MWEMWFGERVRSKPISWSQDEVTRKIDERKHRGEGRGGPSSYKMDRVDGVPLGLRSMREENCDGKSSLDKGN